MTPRPREFSTIAPNFKAGPTYTDNSYATLSGTVCYFVPAPFPWL